VISRRFSAWHKVVALAPLLLLAIYLPGQIMLRCRIDGLVRPACCCPQHDEPESPGPTLSAQGCCSREVTQNQRPVVEAARAAEPERVWAAAAPMFAAPAALAPAPVTSLDRASQRHGPPRGGPPLVLAKHAFLI
jgi:hypothetical protein